MKTCLRESAKIKKEADAVLSDSKLIDLLGRFGRVELTGSYYYDLMTWRDIDLCLTVSKPTPALMMKIGNALSKMKGVATMYYRDEFVLKTPANPRCIFWILEILHKKKLWKIDVLVSDEKEVTRITATGRILMKRLTPETRERILKLKTALSKRKGYRKEFRSTDIYDAVLRGRVKTLKEWGLWKRARN